jgi:anti-sigma-K factor RskA
MAMQSIDMTGDFEMAEYVLGLLDSAENETMERRLRKDASLRETYGFWIKSFESLNSAYLPKPAPVPYDAVARRLFGVPEKKSMPIWLKLTLACGVLIVLLVKLKIILTILS